MKFDRCQCKRRWMQQSCSHRVAQVARSARTRTFNWLVIQHERTTTTERESGTWISVKIFISHFTRCYHVLNSSTHPAAFVLHPFFFSSFFWCRFMCQDSLPTKRCHSRHKRGIYFEDDDVVRKKEKNLNDPSTYLFDKMIQRSDLYIFV